MKKWIEEQIAKAKAAWTTVAALLCMLGYTVNVEGPKQCPCGPDCPCVEVAPDVTPEPEPVPPAPEVEVVEQPAI